MFWKKEIANKYNYLLVTILTVIICVPFLGFIKSQFPFVTLLFLVAMISAFNVVLTKKQFYIISSVGIAAFAVNLLLKLFFHSESEFGNVVLPEIIGIAINLILYLFFFGYAIITLLKKISSYREVTGDVIKGGISVYFLIAFFWAMLYMLISLLQNDAFKGLDFGSDEIQEVVTVESTGNYQKVTEDPQINSNDFIYLSFVTLTTLGYGDIVPLSPLAKIACTIEAFVGQIYIAIFIAQLIGKNIALHLKE